MVYPNPFHEIIMVGLPAIPENVTIQLFNSTGQEIFKSQANNEKLIKINPGRHLTKGIYMLKIEAKATVSWFKLIKE
jgi:hypothetical protein